MTGQIIWRLSFKEAPFVPEHPVSRATLPNCAMHIIVATNVPNIILNQI